MSNILLAAASAAALAAALPPSAEPAEPTTVDTVTAARNPEDPPVVAEVRERLSRTPGAVAVVSNETFENRTAQGLSDILREAPCVLVQGFHQRGVLLAQDGVPFADADGFSDFQGIDPLIARFVEVYKGGNTLRFGGAHLGGADERYTAEFSAVTVARVASTAVFYPGEGRGVFGGVRYRF